ncbi:MAG: cation-translocating P-type ATPase [Tissierellia bacterium]|nr:cation-translocating P-type ATPase [Tissierellia bacterium]
MKLIPHSSKIELLYTELSASPGGLSRIEADERLKNHGPNELKEKKRKTNFARFIDQFKDMMIVILLIAALVSFAIAVYEGETKGFAEPLLILLIVILNALMGTLQEAKAEKALEALKSLTSLKARVYRDGIEQVLDSALLVPGDVIHLEAGDFVPADARLIESSSLKSDESALTGESVPVDKNAQAQVGEGAPLGDRVNMVYSGCPISYGTSKALVTETGMDTQIGKIAQLLDNEEDAQTPLQHKLSKLGTNLGFIALAACGLVFIVGIIDKIPPMVIFMTSVSLAVSVIPEGLPAVVTIVLSLGIQRMVKKNAIIRKLPAVETLGSASVICSDKTGTLTMNQMTLIEGYARSHQEELLKDKISDELKDALGFATLCSNGTIRIEEEEVFHIGDPTETALIYAALLKGKSKEQLEKEFPRVYELPFDSERKLMSTIHKIDEGYLVITKGAFDVLENLCVKTSLTHANSISENMSTKALRVLALGIKYLEELPQQITPAEIEKDLELIALFGMIDPPREEAKEAVKRCKHAGIKPVMITGDHILTAKAIAKELGIFNQGDEAITGAELDLLSDQELIDHIRKISVYARVSPENKIRIVKAWQNLGEIVAMTGDGVNDAPALKAADIGCAMGITGTDVAKNAADMTLTDDNFATIVEAVEEGRGIYANIRKVVGFLLSCNVGELFSVLIAMLIWRETPLLSMHLLWINLVTDGPPALALGVEAVEKDVMEQRPVKRDENIFARGLGLRIALQGAMFTAITLSAFYIGKSLGGSITIARTMAFFVLATSQIVHSFNMRSDHSIFKLGFFTNKSLNLAALISVALMLLVLFPLHELFQITILAPKFYLYGIGLSLVPLVFEESRKRIFK